LTALHGAYRYGTGVEFKIQIFHAWKVVENEANGCRIFDHLNQNPSGGWAVL